jgi:hypothetical protein
MRGAHAFSFSFSAVAAFLVLAGSCGGKVVVDAGSGGAGASTTGTTATSTGAGGASSTGTTATSTGAGGTCTNAPSGDCASDADCNGGTCSPIVPGGYLVCLDQVPQATSCTPPVNGMNQCCTSADCMQGKCYSTQSLPSCGGPARPLYNACVTDQCVADADCSSTGGAASQACLPAGAYGEPMRTCLPAFCHTDADCTAQPCGVCAPIVGPCCSTPTGLGCVYPGGCTKSSDCGNGTSCELDPKTGASSCVASGGVCPV